MVRQSNLQFLKPHQECKYQTPESYLQKQVSKQCDEHRKQKRLFFYIQVEWRTIKHFFFYFENCSQVRFHEPIVYLAGGNFLHWTCLVSCLMRPQSVNYGCLLVFSFGNGLVHERNLRFLKTTRFTLLTRMKRINVLLCVVLLKSINIQS